MKKIFILSVLLSTTAVNTVAQASWLDDLADMDLAPTARLTKKATKIIKHELKIIKRYLPNGIRDVAIGAAATVIGKTIFDTIAVKPYNGAKSMYYKARIAPLANRVIALVNKNVDKLSDEIIEQIKSNLDGIKYIVENESMDTEKYQQISAYLTNLEKMLKAYALMPHFAEQANTQTTPTTN